MPKVPKLKNPSPRTAEYLELEESLGITATAAAEIMGISSAAISRWKKGLAAPDPQNLQLLIDHAVRLGKNINRDTVKNFQPEAVELTDRQSASVKPKLGSGPYFGTRTTVPILGPVSAGLGCEAIDDGGEYEQIETDCRHESSYAVTVDGHSMEDQYQPGDVLVVDPGAGYHSGDLVVVKLTNGEALFKEWQGGSPSSDSISLVSYNEKYKSLEILKQDIDKVHRIHSMIRRLRTKP